MQIISYFIYFNIFLAVLSLRSNANQCSTYLEDISKLSYVEMAFRQFDFPPEGEFYIFEKLLRKAIYLAFDGKDFYTGKDLAFEDMTIDHVIPRSKNGPDNVYNYVPTTHEHNLKKGKFFKSKDMATLALVKDVYGPKVLLILKDLGAFNNRDVELEQARRDYSLRNSKREKSLDKLRKRNISPSHIDSKLVYRRQLDNVSDDIIYILYLLTLKIQNSQTNLLSSTSYISFVLDIDSTKINNINFEDLHITLSSRMTGSKLQQDSLSISNTLYKVIEVTSGLKGCALNIEVHPYLVARLQSISKYKGSLSILEEIKLITKPQDISHDEFLGWVD